MGGLKVRAFVAFHVYTDQQVYFFIRWFSSSSSVYLFSPNMLVVEGVLQVASTINGLLIITGAQWHGCIMQPIK